MSKFNLVDKSYDWNDMTLWEYLNEGNIPSTWIDFFLQDDVQVDLFHISEELKKEVSTRGITIFPAINNIFRSFIPLEKIKVIILGQDPYFSGTDITNCSAVGYCFSVRPGNKINPSLRNIYQELENEGFSPTKNGVITHWADQGCVLLNTAITVAKGQADSHTHIWYEFSKKVIKYIVENVDFAVWFLMGGKALKFKSLISKNHSVVVTSHPSPLSAYRGFQNYPSFLGSNAFQNINKILKKNNRKPIKW